MKPLIIFSIAALGVAQSAGADPPTASDVVRGFIAEVRSGNRPDRVVDYFAEQVAAHQVTSEGATTVMRSRKNYEEHIHEFLALFGDFDLQVDEFLASGDRVYVRWTQRGVHQRSLDGEVPSGKPIIDITSAVYRVHDGRIVEYWLQNDRLGLEIQRAKLGAEAAANGL